MGITKFKNGGRRSKSGGGRKHWERGENVSENKKCLGPEGTQTCSNLERGKKGQTAPQESSKKNPVGVGLTSQTHANTPADQV